jgi:conjugative transposon TraK protein
MFPKTKNIESSFRMIRMTCLAVVAGSFAFNVLMFFKASEMVSREQSRIYLLSAGKVFEAFSGDREPNLLVEARGHVKEFLKDFFTLDPDEKVINENLGRALYLADASAKRLYESLKESGYYANVISGNISQRISIDTVRLDLDSYPFYFHSTGVQIITRPTSVVTRSLITEGYLRNVSRSDNNLHGFLIERWSILENRDLKVENR